jgi:hypothetical protein
MVINLTCVVINFLNDLLGFQQIIFFCTLDLLTELARREKAAGIFPDTEVDLFMKVINNFIENCSKPKMKSIKCSKCQGNNILTIYLTPILCILFVQATAMEGAESNLIVDYILKVS